MKKKLILITNDDGISAKGIKELYKTVKDFGDIFVIAPNTSKSGSSHATTLDKFFKVKKIKFLDTFAYKVWGTPVDCVKLSFLKFLKRKPDIVISGINHGPNTGSNIIYSGTVGAASEASFLGIPSIAVSLFSFDKNADFSNAKRVTRIITKLILTKTLKLKKHTMLNINVPYVKNIKGVKILPKGKYEYKEIIREKIKRNEKYYLIDLVDKKNKKHRNQKKLNDVEAIDKGYITITPLYFDLTDYDTLEEIKNLDIKI